MTTTAQFGPLATPIHLDAAGPGEPAWRDNAYLGIWDSERHVFGEIHVSTSPNAGGRRARVELYIEGSFVEIDEEVDPGTWQSKSISFDADGFVKVDHPDLSMDVTYTPRFEPVDYTAGAVMGGLVEGKPLVHWEQGCDVRGTLRTAAAEVDLRGHGFRDRTWGFRNEARQWREYMTVWGVFDGFDVTAMKFMGTDGVPVLDGFIVSADGVAQVTGMDYTYDAAGLATKCVLTLEDGQSKTVNVVGVRGAGFWLPMGPPEQQAPAFHAFDEFPSLEAWGSVGKGIVAYGILRHL